MENKGVFCKCGCQRFVKLRTDGIQREFFKGHKIGKASDHNLPTAAFCGNCNQAITIEKWRVDKFEKVFCNRKCASTFKSVIAKKLFTCLHCGKQFHLKPSRKQSENTFCSLDCFYQHRVAQNKDKHSNNAKCAYCQKEFYVYPSKLKKNKAFYCNVECRAKFITGSNNPAFSGGENPSLYGENWKRQRRLARLRDGNKCVLCLKQPKRKKGLHVHHKIEISQFNGDFVAGNDLTNLITLCDKCHKKVHSGTISLLP